jgi:hypothetical protein
MGDVTGKQPWQPAFGPASRTASLVTAVHLAFAAGFALVVVLYFGRMSFEGADRAAMLAMQHDPKDIVPFGLHGLNRSRGCTERSPCSSSSAFSSARRCSRSRCRSSGWAGTS